METDAQQIYTEYGAKTDDGIEMLLRDWIGGKWLLDPELNTALLDVILERLYYGLPDEIKKMGVTDPALHIPNRAVLSPILSGMLLNCQKRVTNGEITADEWLDKMDSGFESVIEAMGFSPSP